MNESRIRGPENGDPGGGSFYQGALERIRRTMLVLAVVLPFLAWYWRGWRVATGLACGCAIAYVNFQWLVRGVEGMAERMAGTGNPRSGKGIVSRFLLRYILMGAAAYVILTVSPRSLYGLLAGLFLPVAAIACEAGYELYAALARGV